MATNKMLGSFDVKAVPEDNDLLIEYDKTANKVKNVTMNGVWTWITKKLTASAISDLKTSSKYVVGAINELKAKFDRTTIDQNSLISNLHTDITIQDYECSIRNNVINIYFRITVANKLSGAGSDGLSIMKYAYAPTTKYKICTFTITSVPYTPLTSGASYWIDSSGVVMLYGTLPAGSYYMTSEYVVR